MKVVLFAFHVQNSIAVDAFLSCGWLMTVLWLLRDLDMRNIFVRTPPTKNYEFLFSVLLFLNSFWNFHVSQTFELQEKKKQ